MYFDFLTGIGHLHKFAALHRFDVTQVNEMAEALAHPPGQFTHS
jgi:hypothetical protein